MKYYDLQRNWTRKIAPHLDDPEVVRVLRHDFKRYGHRDGCVTYRPRKWEVPADWDTSDWRIMERRPGPMPRYWDYVCTGACHWLVNFSLMLAMRAEPDRPWRILSGYDHSTVWDGDKTLFELNWYAFRMPPKKCYKVASKRDGKALLPGQLAPVFIPRCS